TRPRPRAGGGRRQSPGSEVLALVFYLLLVLDLYHMNATANTPLDLTDELYARLPDRVATGRRRLGRPLTLTEKILLNHLADPEHAGLERGQSYVELYPDRVALQDATGQMALLQFMTAGLPRTAVPTAVHADHLIQARIDAATDLAVAEDANDEVYDFLRI